MDADTWKIEREGMRDVLYIGTGHTALIINGVTQAFVSSLVVFRRLLCPVNP